MNRIFMTFVTVCLLAGAFWTQIGDAICPHLNYRHIAKMDDEVQKP